MRSIGITGEHAKCQNKDAERERHVYEHVNVLVPPFLKLDNNWIAKPQF